MPPSWRWRALRLLRVVGLRAVPVAPGAVLVARRDSALNVPVRGDGAALVIDPDRVRRGWYGLEKRLAHDLVNRHVATVLDQYDVSCVLDVGANKGQYAVALRAAGYQGHIVSFEPVPRDFEVLAARAAKDPRWTAHRLALGREDGELEMNVVPGTLSSFLPSTQFGAGRYARLQAPEVVTAPVRRLDGILDEVTAHIPDPRIYLKLDTQGFDLEAFAGLGDRAADLVGMQSEVALMEIYDGMPRLPEALAAYEAAGFEVTAFYPISRESRTGRVLEFDCVMVRASALGDG
ncbi:MAG TPA: FkbM family methyltransferase [Actinomycetes bacterium]